jgi:hypothetical protein
MPPLGGSATPDWSREWLTLAKMRVAGHLFFFFFYTKIPVNPKG